MAARVAAIHGLGGEGVVPADVALGASGHFSSGRQLVRVGQRESRRAVVKLAIRPKRDCVARGASRCAGWEIRSYVVWHVAADRLCAVPG